MPFLFFLGLLAGLAWYVLKPQERRRLLDFVMARTGDMVRQILRLRRPPDPLDEVLRERTPLTIATPALVTVNVAVFIGIALGNTPSNDPETLLAWGAGLGTQIANGEWWRLLTAGFAHPGLVVLAVNMTALLSVGRVLERLVGPLAFSAVYVAAALMGAVVSVTSSTVEIFAGASAAVFGLYGLLIAAWSWGAWQGATTTIRLRTAARLAPAATAFVVYHIAEHGVVGTVEQMGVITGFICGTALAHRAAMSKPGGLKIAASVAITACLAVASVVPLRGMADVRPEIEQLRAMEAQHRRTYEDAVRKVRRGPANQASLIEVIEQTILPEIRDARGRIAAFEKIPSEQRHALAAAETYLRLRDDAWRLRVRALRHSSASMLRQADDRGHAALDVLRRAETQRR